MDFKFAQNGNHNVQIGNVENMYLTQNRESLCSVGTEIDYTYYNLFVTDDSKFRPTPDKHSGTIFIPITKMLKIEYTAPSISKQFMPLVPKNKICVKNFPSVFAAESKIIDGYNEIDPEQSLYVGYVQDINVKSEILEISFEAPLILYQTELVKLSDALQLVKKPRYSELEDAHWAIKNVNLKKILQNAKIRKANIL